MSAETLTNVTLPAHLRAYRDSGRWFDRTVADWALERAEADPDAVVFFNDGLAPTYVSLLEDARALAASLYWDCGMRPGEVVAFQTPNWSEAAIINLAAAIAGFVICPIVTIYRDAEVAHMLSNSGARIFFHADQYRGYDYAAMVRRVQPKLPELRQTITVRSTDRTPALGDLIASGRGRELPTGKVDPDAVKLLLYTSGTTGRAKGVLHSHNTLTRVTKLTFEQWRIGLGDTVLMPSPISHISGYCAGLEQPFLNGSRTVLMEAWDAAEALRLIEEHRIVGTVAATPFLAELVQQIRGQGRDLPGFRVFACGGAAVPADLVRDANSAFAQPCAFRVYGSSEAPLITLGCSPGEEPEIAAATDGRVVDYDVRFVDDVGQDVPDGREGEIVVQGPAVFLGYLDEGDTREAFTADGYFRTGDLGLLTAEGAVVITGRKKDLIIRGGENISAKEIEDVLLRHGDILDAAVVSMPHSRLGEGICAYIVPSGEAVPDRETLAAFVTAAGLAKQKCPERVEIVESLPRTPSGKVRKDILRDRIREALSSRSA